MALQSVNRCESSAARLFLSCRVMCLFSLTPALGAAFDGVLLPVRFLSLFVFLTVGRTLFMLALLVIWGNGRGGEWDALGAGVGTPFPSPAALLSHFWGPCFRACGGEWV